MTSIRLTKLLPIILLAACTPRIIVKPAALPTYPKPTLVPVPAKDVQCLAPGTYTTIVDRENKLRTWGEKLWVIIDTNNKAAAQQGSAKVP